MIGHHGKLYNGQENCCHGERGKAGKSFLNALVSRYLKNSTLLVDLDHNLSFPDVFRFDYHKESYKLQK